MSSGNYDVQLHLIHCVGCIVDWSPLHVSLFGSVRCSFSCWSRGGGGDLPPLLFSEFTTPRDQCVPVHVVDRSTIMRKEIYGIQLKFLELRHCIFSYGCSCSMEKDDLISATLAAPATALSLPSPPWRHYLYNGSPSFLVSYETLE